MMSGGQLCMKDTVPQAVKTQINTARGGRGKGERRDRRGKVNGF